MSNDKRWNAFLDYAASSTLHPKAREAIFKAIENWPISLDESLKIIDNAKELFAKLINASREEIALIPNITTSVVTVINSLPLSSKTGIVTNNLEFPSNRFTWQVASRYGYKVREVIFKGIIPDEGKIVKAISSDDYLIAISHVFYQSGYRVNLKELYEVSKAKDALLFVDAYQSVGAIRVNAKLTDFLVCGSGKWLMSIPGSGFLYVSRRIIDQLRPPYRGWMSTINPKDFSAESYIPSSTASKLESGFPAIIGYIAITEVMKEILNFGLYNVESRVLSLTQWLIDELNKFKLIDIITPSIPSKRAGIISFTGKFDIQKLYNFLYNNRIKVSKRDNLIRISIHYITNEEEIQLLINYLKEFFRRF